MRRCFISLLCAFLFLCSYTETAHTAVPKNYINMKQNTFISGDFLNGFVVEALWVLKDDADPTHMQPGTQIVPAPGGEKKVSVYTIIRPVHIENIDVGKVYVHFYSPNGLKVKRGEARGLIAKDNRLKIETALKKAQEAKLIKLSKARELKSMVFQGEALMLEAALPMYHYDPAGKYTVEIAVENDGVNGAFTCTQFEWQSACVVTADFDTICFGTIQPGKENVLPGDFDIETVESPTLWNEGNTSLHISANINPLIGQESGASIHDFTVTFGDEKIAVKAPQTIIFEEPLEINQAKGITFSISPLPGTESDMYKGSISISASTIHSEEYMRASNRLECFDQKQILETHDALTKGSNAEPNNEEIYQNAPVNGEKSFPNSSEHDSSYANNKVPNKIKPQDISHAPPEVEIQIEDADSSSGGASTEATDLSDESETKQTPQFQSADPLSDSPHDQIVHPESNQPATQDKMSNESYDIDTTSNQDRAFDNKQLNTPINLEACFISSIDNYVVELEWGINVGLQFAGFNIYRKNVGSKDYQKLNDEPQKDNFFSDTKITAGELYSYVVKTVDFSGHESVSSSEVMIKVDQPAVVQNGFDQDVALIDG